MKYQGICHGKGRGAAPPPPPSSVQQTTTSEFPTELRPFISDIFEKGQAIQEQRQEEGFQPELTQQLAGFTPEQETSFTEIANIQRQPPPPPVTYTNTLLQPDGLLHVPLEVHTCIERTPEAADSVPHVIFDPLLLTKLSVLPDGLGRIYADDPANEPLISMSFTVNVPLAVIPPLENVKPPIPPTSLIAPRFNCAILQDFFLLFL